jgi:hypothetical protein
MQFGKVLHMQAKRGIDGIHMQQAYIHLQTFTDDDVGKGTIKFMQPVLIKKINEEYNLTDGTISKTTAVAGQVLVKGNREGTVSPNQINVPFCH